MVPLDAGHPVAFLTIIADEESAGCVLDGRGVAEVGVGQVIANHDLPVDFPGSAAVFRKASTDAEACAYLYTTGLTAPFDHDWTQIYLYIAGKTYTREKKAEMPDDIRVESLNDDQMRDLNRLKTWLYQKRTIVRLDRERAERCQKKEEETARKEAAQPALFDF